jgi:methyltransferase family protein
MPWWMKIGAKMVLSRLPVSYDRWRSIGLFKHGAMQRPQYALDVFARHFEHARPFLADGFTALELGPGDSLASAVIARAHGARRVYLIDAGSFATSTDVSPYNEICEELARRGRPVAGAPFAGLPAMLEAAGAEYLTGGFASLASLPDNSVDWVFSQAVLEHVALPEFAATVGHLYRIQRRGGPCSHRIDLQDHLDHNLHSLRFPRDVWESSLFAASGFYTNRLRAGQIVDIFSAAGYRIVSRRDETWSALPLPAAKLHAEFRALPQSELLVRGFDLLAQK